MARGRCRAFFRSVALGTTAGARRFGRIVEEGAGPVGLDLAAGREPFLELSASTLNSRLHSRHGDAELFCGLSVGLRRPTRRAEGVACRRGGGAEHRLEAARQLAGGLVGLVVGCVGFGPGSSGPSSRAWRCGPVVVDDGVAGRPVQPGDGLSTRSSAPEAMLRTITSWVMSAASSGPRPVRRRRLAVGRGSRPSPVAAIDRAVLVGSSSASSARLSIILTKSGPEGRIRVEGNDPACVPRRLVRHRGRLPHGREQIQEPP